MSLLDAAIAIQSTSWATTIRESKNIYPIILSTHLAAIALFGGMILVVNMRLLGVAFRGYTVTELVRQLRVPKRIGFVIIATCGLFLASSKAEEYYYNKLFWTKMSLLALVAVHGLVFRRGVYANTEALDQASRMPGRARLAAGLSLLLWISIACAGRGIGYIEAPLELLHAGAVKINVVGAP